MASSTQPSHPILYVTGGDQDGLALRVDSPGFEKVIGSGPDCHMRLDSAAVDYHHAQVSWEEEGFLVSDLGSARGTYVNGQRVETTRRLQDGDRLSLGPPGSSGCVKLLVRVPRALGLAASAGPVFEAPAASPAMRDPGPTPGITPGAPSPAPAPWPSPAPARPRLPSADDVSDAPAVVTDRTWPAVPTLPPSVLPPARTLPALSRQTVLAAGVAILLLAGGVAFLMLRRPKPVVSSLSPVVAAPGQSLTLAGSGFDEAAAGNVVWLGDRKATVTAATTEQLTVTVPADLSASSKPLPVSVETDGGRSDPVAVTLRRAPRITRVEPDVALPGAEVTLRGFDLEIKGLTVHVDGVPAEVRQANPGALRFVVPAMPIGGGRAARVTVEAGADRAGPLTLLLGRLPLLQEVSPARARVGERVVVKGRGFDGGRVTVDGQPALVIAAGASELAIVVPHVSGGGSGPVAVVVQAGGSASEALLLAVERPSAAVYRPRFFAAEAGAPELAFVSVELGPVMLLSAADGRGGVGIRALEVASALNVLFQRRDAAALRFEARPGDPPVVAAAGQPSPLVRVLAEDAAAYARTEPGGARGARVSPGVVAAHWAAVLQDLVALCIAFQRPVNILERTPRGQVLLDLYATAARRGAQGVPMSLVDPLPTTTARAFRELALQPGAARSAPGAAVAGVWEGFLSEDGVGERPLRVRITLAGARLAGTATTQAGALTMDAPLRDVAYDKGALRFIVGAGANERRFQGRVDGDVISGAVQGPDNRAVGTLRLRFTE